jgi:hypothetical protein
MTEYQVTWTIELSADNPTEAAMQARTLLLDPHSEAVHFSVAPFSEIMANGAAAKYEDVDLSEVDFTVLDNTL